MSLVDENVGKFYNQSETTKFFGDLESAISVYKEAASAHEMAQSTISNTSDYQGESATSTKHYLTFTEKKLLDDIIALQDDLVTLQKDIQQKFTDEVDSAKDANLEYDVIKKIEDDFKALYAEFDENAKGVEALAERCKSYTKYYRFTGVDFTSERQSFVDFCGGNEEATGYLNTVKNLLVTFDYEAQGMILERGLDYRINSISSRVIKAFSGCYYPFAVNLREENLRKARVENEKHAQIASILIKDEWTEEETIFLTNCYITARKDEDLSTLKVFTEGLTTYEKTLMQYVGNNKQGDTFYQQTVGLNPVKVARLTDCMVADFGIDAKSMMVINLHNAADRPIIVSGDGKPELEITVEKCDKGISIVTAVNGMDTTRIQQDLYWDDKYYDKIYKEAKTSFDVFKNQYELLKDDENCAMYNYCLKSYMISTVDMENQSQFDYLVSDVVDRDIVANQEFVDLIRNNSSLVMDRCNNYWKNTKDYDDEWYYDNAKLSGAMGYLVIESLLDDDGLKVKDFIYDSINNKNKIIALESLILSNPPQGEMSMQLLNRMENAPLYPLYKGKQTCFTMTEGYLDSELLATYYVNHDAYVIYSDHSARVCVSALVDIIPYVGEVKMVIDGMAGKDLITGDELSEEEIALTVFMVVCGGLLKSATKMPTAVYGLEEVTVASEKSVIEAGKVADNLVDAEQGIIKLEVVEQTVAHSDEFDEIVKNKKVWSEPDIQSLSIRETGYEAPVRDVETFLTGEERYNKYKEMFGDGNVVWENPIEYGPRVYTYKTLDELEHTQNFKPGSITHVFEGELKYSNKRGLYANGYHYEMIEGTGGTIIAGTESAPNAYGVYKASVEYNGILKKDYDGVSTFFPKDMSPQEVVDAINEAYSNCQLIPASKNTYTGVTSTGLTINMYLDPNYKIISAYPVY